MDLTVEEVKKGERIIDVDKYFRDEITRVEKALEDAKKNFVELQQSKIMTRDKAVKMSELNYAISVGKIYLRKLKNKI